jgi:hypothetical protein
MIEEGAGTRRPAPDQAVQRQHQLFYERINPAVLLGEPDLPRPRRAQGLVGQVDVDAVQLTAELNREVEPGGMQEQASGGDPTAQVRSADPSAHGDWAVEVQDQQMGCRAVEALRERGPRPGWRRTGQPSPARRWTVVPARQAS